MMRISKDLKEAILKAQKNETTEYFVYNRLAEKAKGKNKKILQKIAQDEKGHYEFWKKYTKTEVQPSRFKIFIFTLAANIFGLTFGSRLMERGEDLAQQNYKKLLKIDPKVKKILKDEETHEHELIDMIDSKSLQYAGSFVLGLNDALVELTGALAGLTLALQDTNLIATVGLITGIAASMSMAASEYLSTKEEGGDNAKAASFYTGIAYIITVLVLIAPFFIVQNPFTAIAITLGLGVVIIFLFTFYTAIAKNQNFPRKFGTMVLISLGVAVINFGIGHLVKTYIADV